MGKTTAKSKRAAKAPASGDGAARPAKLPAKVFAGGARAPPARAGADAGVHQGPRAEGGRGLRGPRRRRQGRGHPAHRRAPQPPRLPRRRPRHPDRAREDPVVLPALRPAPARRRRDGPVRPLLVQPRRRGAGDGLLHRARVPGVHALLPGVRADAGALGDRPRQVLVLGERRRAGAALPGPRQRPDATVEAEPDGPQVAREVGRLLAREGRDVQRTPTSSRRPGTW